MSDYTPTTEEVRRQWAKKQRDVWGNPGLRALRKDFDRWLAEHDRELSERVWEEGERRGRDNERALMMRQAQLTTSIGAVLIKNPYRQGENK